MDKRSSQVIRVCECIDQCFAYVLWCDDFVQFIDPDDLVAGLDRGRDVVSDATRLQSFLALRKLDEFLSDKKSKPDDLVVSTLGIDGPKVLGGAGNSFLTEDERADVNKGVAHLADRLTLDEESDLDLETILTRSIPAFSRLAAELRKADTSQEAAYWLDKTDALIRHESDQEATGADGEEKVAS